MQNYSSFNELAAANTAVPAQSQMSVFNEVSVERAASFAGKQYPVERAIKAKDVKSAQQAIAKLFARSGVFDADYPKLAEDSEFINKVIAQLSK